MAAVANDAGAGTAGSRSRRKSTTAVVPNGVARADGKSPRGGDRSRPGSRMENGVAAALNGKHHHDDGGGKEHHHHHGVQGEDKLAWWHYLLIALLAYVSYAAYPGSLSVAGEAGGTDRQKVFYYGWITALSTGLGTLPFAVVSEMNKYWLGISNAAAAGMMLAASTSLVYEGIIMDESGFDPCVVPQSLRVLIGLLGGLLFIVSTKKLLDEHEEIKIAGLDGLEARKVLLLIFVMTLHSFTEGVGIGVSFGGKNGPKLGQFISLTLAVHNVPEGLAVALVMVPKRVNKVKTALWSIFTSIPQPLMAVPAYMFVEEFMPFLPIGLGFAAGAMLWVAVFELIADAYEDLGSKKATAVICSLAYAGMMLLQMFIKEEEEL